jgi:hypothetical protein
MRDLPPGAQGLGVEERLQHARRRRRDYRGHVQAGGRCHRCFTAEIAEIAEKPFSAFFAISAVFSS